MKAEFKGFEIIVLVKIIFSKIFKRLPGLGVHETSNQTIYRAIPVYPGNPLFELLRRKKNHPLPFPSI